MTNADHYNAGARYARNWLETDADELGNTPTAYARLTLARVKGPNYRRDDIRAWMLGVARTLRAV